MGIIKASIEAIRSSLADQWREIVEPDDMGAGTVMTAGKLIRRNENTKGTQDLISNGSVIHVQVNQCMLLVDGGKVVDFTDEEGYYIVDDGAPSLFSKQFKDTLKDSVKRIMYGGGTPYKQKVYYINLQEIKGIKFGTKTPINYFDSFYGAELFLRAHGEYSIKIVDPLLFYAEAIPRNMETVQISDINSQYLSEFLSALQTAVNRMSADGIRISHVTSKSVELSKYMATALDEEWRQLRGLEVCSVGLSSLSYSDDSQELINMRNKGAMLSDPMVREGYVQGSIARGIEAAGSNEAGSMAGFMGVGVGMNAAGGFMGAASSTNMQQMQMNGIRADTWRCQCGYENTGGFCQGCGKQKPEAGNAWSCECGANNTGNFCQSCGRPKPKQAGEWQCGCGVNNTGSFCQSCGARRRDMKLKCDKCGFELKSDTVMPKFCPNCGDPIDSADMKP